MVIDVRCNLIDPIFLSDQHLIAERRELRMIPPLFISRVRKNNKPLFNIPKEFTLNKGHMLFWMDKILYLEKRYDLLTQELLNRNFKPDLSIQFSCETSRLFSAYNDWTPSENDISIIKKRIKEKLLMKSHWYRYYSKPVNAEFLQYYEII